MTKEELKAAQTPLKESYKTNPEAAMVTLRAEGNLSEDISCRVETGKAFVKAGLHRATGGSGLQACSGDMLLQALVACAGVTLGAVATSLEIHIKNGIIRAEGDLDFKGTLGVSKEALVGFKAIRLSFQLETEATQEQLDTLLKLTERYCVVYQTLSKSPVMSASYVKRS